MIYIWNFPMPEETIATTVMKKNICCLSSIFFWCGGGMGQEVVQSLIRGSVVWSPTSVVRMSKSQPNVYLWMVAAPFFWRLKHSSSCVNLTYFTHIVCCVVLLKLLKQHSSSPVFYHPWASWQSMEMGEVNSSNRLEAPLFETGFGAHPRWQ